MRREVLAAGHRLRHQQTAPSSDDAASARDSVFVRHGFCLSVRGESSNFSIEATMTDRRTQQDSEQGNTIKDPDQWTTGDEPMTGAQRSYLHTLAEEARENV